ncbi:sulfite exporter TauE/SafE family protein, partial [Cribrihabitans sp. XS_ASV171]
ATLGPYWKRWSWPDARVLLLGGVPGVALGAALYRAADADALRLLIGAISLLFVIWHVSQVRGLVPQIRRRLPLPVGLFAGLVTGFTSFVSHAGGPPAAVYLLSQRLGKTEFQATTVLIFWALNIAKFIPYAWLGMLTWQTGWACLLLAPFAILGAWMGVRAHRMISERAFFAVAYVLLTLTGTKLIWDALT